MNLLARIKAGLILTSGLLFFSCDDDEGLSFNTQESISLDYEELVFETSNLVIDSLRTDFSNYVLTGDYTHDLLGRATAEAYLQFRYDSGTVLSDTLVFDNMSISVKVEEFVKNTTEDQVPFEIYFLGRKLYDDVVYLSDFDAQKQPTPIDTFQIRVREENRVSIGRVDELGKFLFDTLLTSDSLTTDYIGQIAIAPIDGSEALTKLAPRSDSTFLSIFSRGPSGLFYETKFEIVNYYTGIERDRSINGDSPENLETFDLSGQSILSPLFGIYPIVDLTPLKDFTMQIGDIVVNKAEIITPIEENDDPLAGIRYYFFKPSNGISGEGRYLDPYNTLILANESYFPQASLQLLTAEIEDQNYVADVTLFTEFFTRTFTSQQDFLTDKLVLIGTDFVTLDEISVNDNIRLRLYYSSPSQ